MPLLDFHAIARTLAPSITPKACRAAKNLGGTK